MEGEGLFDSFKCALRGCFLALAAGRNAKIHLMFAAFIIILAAILRPSPVEWAAIVLCIAVVLSSELVNTAIEAMLDGVMPEYHPMVKVAKDMAAGAVLITAMASAFIGLIILGPRLWVLVFG
jgi:diacylglycerol kinase